ncbi:hypothetical protein [Oceanithermus sp.]|uniref:hypothetical protein n=1 Tax=Oceanithermus sp. TaxID=2268145 RepID=UPI00257E63AB|nr:hypothetical protein [Oceanithermus sp.]
MARKFNYERASRMLAEAMFHGDHAVVERYGTSLRSLQRYRRRLADGDRVLADLVAEKKAALEREWAGELAPAIREGIMFLRRAAKAADPSDPDAIHAVAGSLKILSEIALTKEVLDARFAATDRPHGQADRAVVTPQA